MKTLLSSLAAAVVIMALTGCTTPGVKPQIPPGTDLTRYRTFAVLPMDKNWSAEPLPAKTAMATAASAAAAHALIGKGLRQAGEAEADLLVEISGSAVMTPSYYFRQPWFAQTRTVDVYYTDSAFPQMQTQLKLLVELRDRATQKTVWQASQSETLPTQPSPQTAANITKFILASYPSLPAPP